MIRLRPHHLLCILTYVGRGYTPAFTKNMNAVTARIFAGEPVEIVSGPDDICAPLLCEADAHCHRAGIDTRDALAAQALGVSIGETVDLPPARLAQMRADFAAGILRQACKGCEWDSLCTEVARCFPIQKEAGIARPL